MHQPGSINHAVVLMNLGTPDSPAVPDVRRYLRQFLSDRRIVAAPRAFWIPFLRLVLLPLYAPRSAARYASIWTLQGSPQRVITERQADGLSRRLDGLTVRYAMRYSTPSLPSVLDELRAKGTTDVTLLSLFPQSSHSTTGSLKDDLDSYMRLKPGTADAPFAVTLIDRWGDDDAYIEACAAVVSKSWDLNGRPDFDSGDRLLLSFHGLPLSAVKDGDAYPDECHRTAELLRARLGVTDEECLTTYQSKFGPGQWLTPATIETVRRLGASGTRRVDVFCPGFAADCLETLEEIGHQNSDAFLKATGESGGQFHRIDSLNDDSAFLNALAILARRGRL